MTDSIEDRLRIVEMQQAVTTAMMERIEGDLRNIAVSSAQTAEVITGWKGGMGALIMVGGGVMVLISVVVEYFMSRLSK